MSEKGSRLIAAMGLFVVMLGFSTVCRANTIMVNSLNDPGAVGICVLRDAITAANTGAATNGCPGGSGNDTINFAISGTISLTGTLPNIVNTLTIDGSGQSIAVNGNSQQVMYVNGGATLNLEYLTIENGNDLLGGGLYNNGGTVGVTNSTFTNNNSGGFLGEGGGIYNASGC
jgi:fibronectin-binding autotransporter adhesin